MLRCFFSLLVITSTLFSFAQAPRIESDSLLSLLSNAQGKDRVELLITLSDLNISTPEGERYATQALNLARSEKDPALIIRSLEAIGQYYFWHFNEEKALSFFLEALELARATKNAEGEVNALRRVGRTYIYLDSTHLTIGYLKEALRVSALHNLKALEGNAMADLGRIYSMIGSLDTAILLLNQSIQIQKQLGEKLNEANAYKDLGDIYYDFGLYSDAIEAYNQGIRILDELNDIDEVAKASQRLGNTHMSLGNYQLALEQFQLSLSLYEKKGDLLNTALLSYNIGQVFENLSRNTQAVDENRENYKKALAFHEQALKIFQKEEDTRLIGITLNSIANVFARLTQNQYIAQYGENWEDSLQHIPTNVIAVSFSDAIDYYRQALDIFDELQDQEQIAGINLNLGRIYTFTRDWGQAHTLLSKGRQIATTHNLPYHTALSYICIGNQYYRQNNIPLALQNLRQSASQASEFGIKEIERSSYEILSKIYEQLGEYSTALNYYRNSIRIKDEIFNEQSQKIISELQTKYETEKKEQEITLLNNQQALQASVIQRQKLMIFITIIGLVMILGFAILLLRLFQNKRRANRILEEKNELISHQKQEITDSIRYASRIQNAILPADNLLNDSLKDHFVLFLPRNIVSGDFYWFTKQGGKIVLVAADCTGHGVPGAFMSMLGVSFLYEIVNKEGILQAAEILNHLREMVKHTLSQTGKTHEQKDGMDISLAVLDTTNLHLQWAGAYNPLYIIRDGELIEYKANKMPIAVHINDHLPFTNHEIDLVPGDNFYMFSDGFPDQFGGADGRKFMTKRFKELLLNICHLPMEDQKEALYKAHLEWKSDFDQVDDIIILGMNV